MNQNLENLERRVAGYRFVDGLVELGLGVFLCGWGGFHLLDRSLAENSAAGAVMDAIESIFIFVWFFFVVKGVQLLKQRITFPRSGYAEPKKLAAGEQEKRLVIATFIVFLLGSVVLAFTFGNPSGEVQATRNWGVPILAAMMGLIFLWNGFELGIRRFLILGIWSLAVGGGLYLLHLPDLILNRSLFSLAFGAGLLLTGGMTLLRFLKENPPAREEPTL